MTQRRHHYELAFEHYLRGQRVPYVAVNEARKALIAGSLSRRLDDPESAGALKSFDFVLYGEPTNMLAEIKGRKIAARASSRSESRRTVRPRLESWVTRDDVDSLLRWESLFGEDFCALFVFVYWCDVAPGSALFEEIFEFQGRWYALRGIEVSAYEREMKTRSERWGTVHLPTEAFERLSNPLLITPSGTECVDQR